MSGDIGQDVGFEGPWRDFTARLLRRVASLEPDRPLELPVLSTAEGTPVIRVLTDDDTTVFLISVSSNQTLGAPHQLSAVQIDALLGLGWAAPSPPGSTRDIPDFHLVVPDASDVAELVVATLREVFMVPHPDFLRPAPVEADLHGESPPDPHADEDPLPIDEAFHPEGPAELAWAVSQTLRNRFGRYWPPDEDGFFVIRIGSAGLIVRAHPGGFVEFVAYVVTRMRYPDLAEPILERLNERSPYLRFWVSGTDVVASCDIPAVPFVPAHLNAVLDVIGTLVDDADDELATVTGGVRMFGEEGDDRPTDESVDPDEDDDLPEELLTLIQMDSEGASPPDPELVAAAMRFDRSLALSCIRISEQQAIEWRTFAEEAERAGDDAPGGDAETARTESASWEATAALIRSALPVIVGSEAPRPDTRAREVLGSAFARMAPGERLYVSPRGAEGKPPGHFVEIIRYLDDGLLARFRTRDWSLPLLPALEESLRGRGWRSPAAEGATGPRHVVRSLRTGAGGTHEMADEVLRALWEFVDVPPDPADVLITAECPAARAGVFAHGAAIEVTAETDLEALCAEVLEELGREPELFHTAQQPTHVAKGWVSVDVEVSPPALHVYAPVVGCLTDPDEEAIRTRLCESAFSCELDDGVLAYSAVVDCREFSPAHVEAVLAAVEDLVFVTARPIAEATGGLAVIDVDDWLAEHDSDEVESG